MFRHLTKANIFVLLVISLAFGGIIRFAFMSNAASTVTFTFGVSPKGAGVVQNVSGSYVGSCVNTDGISGDRSCTYTTSSSPVTYKATPKTGCKFTRWTHVGTTWSTANPVNIPRDYTRTLVAEFQAQSGQICPPVAVVTPPPVITPPVKKTTPKVTPTVTDSNNDDSSVGEEIVVGNNTTETSSDKEAPTVPTNLSSEYNSDDSSIHLSWDASTDNTAVAGYEIQRQEKGQSTWEAVGNVASEEFTDFEFAPDKTYVYQVRAYDEAQNFSAWSAGKDVTAGAFTPNVTKAEGGTVTDEKKILTIDVPKDAVSEDLVIYVNKVKVKGITLPENSKLVGGFYDIKAKNSQGVEVKTFNRQIVVKFDYGKINTIGTLKSSLKIATSEDGKSVAILKTSLDGTEATTLTDHLSLYFLAAEKNSIWVTLLWILFWLGVVAGIIAAGYFGWRKYMLSKYQKEHREDFIYKH